uniref:Zinc finger MYND-type containing 12 n=1 Tax=Ailuropoda melanoleuca TaxID=9646 RepID=A0A7N5JBK2_AILME
MPFYNSEEERQHGLQQLQQRQKHLIEFCYTVAQKYLFEGKHEAAVPAALHSLRFRMNVHGLSSVELVPAYLLLAEASLGLGQIVQAEEYLSQAQWTVLKSTDCCYATHSLLHRNLGLLHIAKENYKEARYHLANDAQEYAMRAFSLAKEQHLSLHERNTIEELLSLISAEEAHPIPS